MAVSYSASSAQGEFPGNFDTVGRLGLGLSYTSVETLDQTDNARIISWPGYVLNPALEVAMYGSYLLTMESQLRVLKYQAPAAATLTQDSGINTTFSLGLAYRNNWLEVGFVSGLNEGTFISTAPTTNYVSMENMLTPFIGGRLALNLLINRHLFARLEGLYTTDFGATSDRSTLQMTGSNRIVLNSQFGIGKWKDTLRFTAGVTIQNTGSDLGRQRAVYMIFGISIGDLWGERPPMY